MGCEDSFLFLTQGEVLLGDPPWVYLGTGLALVVVRILWRYWVGKGPGSRLEKQELLVGG